MVSSGPGKKANRNIKISCRNIWKVYGESPRQFFKEDIRKIEDVESHRSHIQESNHIVAAYNIGFEIGVGEVFVIMGLSGSGKSTVVRCLSRLVRPEFGEVLLDGQNLLSMTDRELIEIRRHKMGMVFQNFGLFPHMTVLGNVAFPLKVQGIQREKRYRRAREVIDLVGLEGREHYYPRQLSGGQQQRVGFARSLGVEPDVWFLDEPFSALDPLIRKQLQNEFLRLQQMLHKTIVFITHDFLEAIRLADRIAIMRDGRIVQTGTPAEIVMHPANGYVAEFTQDVSRIKVLTAGEIMGRADPRFADARSVSHSTPLEKVLSIFDDQTHIIAVTDDDGTVLGQILPLDIVKAMT
jgi:glycine betaine/proline transport system ATP-binding protein